MKTQGRSWKERICALLLALAMVLTGMLPGSTATAEAAPFWEHVDVTFRVLDSENQDALLSDDVTINVKDSRGENAGTADKAEENGEYIIENLDPDEEYTYTVTKKGYEYADAAAERKFTPSEDEAENVINVSMKMSEISLSETDIHLVVGETKLISVDNAVANTSYEWSVVSGSEYVSVDNNGYITANAGGQAGDDSDKTATVQVTNGRKPAFVNVTVSKENPGEIGLSVEEAQGIDQTTVTLTATNLPADADEQAQVTFNVVEKVGEEYEVIEEIGTVSAKTSDSNPPGLCYTREDGLIGKIYFQAVFSGDVKYKSKSVTELYGPYTQNKAIKIVDTEGNDFTEKEVTYGAVTDDENTWNSPITLKISDTEGRNLSTEVKFINDDTVNCGSPENVADIQINNEEDTITVKPKNAGKIEITVTAEAGSFYESAFASFVLTVKRAELSVGDITWNDAEKVYDGENDIEITGTVNETSEIITVSNAEVPSANVVVKDKTVNEYEKQKVTIPKGTYYSTSTDAQYGNYVLSTDESIEIGEYGVITHRPLYVEIESKKTPEYEYGQDIQDCVEKTEGLVKLVNGNGKKSKPATMEEGDDSGLVGKETLDKLDKFPNATLDLDNPEVDTTMYVGEFVNVVEPNIEEYTYSGNYEFKVDDDSDYKGDLKVTPQGVIGPDEILTNISLTDTTGVYGKIETMENESEEADTILREVWVRVSNNEDLQLKLAVKNSSLFKAANYYDAVYVSIDGGKYQNATDEGISLANYTCADDRINLKNVSIRLVNKDHYNEKDLEKSTYRQVSGTLNDWLYIDNKAPEAHITDFEPTALSKLGDALSFGMLRNMYYTATVEITDEGSGLTDPKTVPQQYYVYEMGSGISDKNLKKGAVEDIVKDLNEGTGTRKWSDLTLNDDGTYTIPVGKGENEEILENNYLIFIKTKDKVGNCEVYVSNGIVIEVQEPEISCTFRAENPEDQSFINSEGIIRSNGNVQYTLKVSDPGSYFSGISRIETRVKEDGNTLGLNEDGQLPALEKVLNEENQAVGSYVYETDQEAGYSYQDLKDDSEIEIEGVVKADEITSNNVVLEVSAYDRAGNSVLSKTWNLILDNKAPEITVEFDKNEPVNDIYYQDSRTMTISYRERNFGFDSITDKSLDNVSKDNVWFELTTENGSGEYSLAELNELDGIEVEFVEDTQGEIEEDTQYTEDRTVTYRIAFTGQNEYTIIPYCKDKLENETQGGEYHFVVDTEAPVLKELTFSYYNEESGQWVPYDPAKPVSATVQVSMVIKEHYFKISDTFEDGQIDFEIGADKTAENDTTDYQEIYGTDVNTKWGNNIVNGSPVEDEWRLTLTFGNDAVYSLDFAYSDLSGKTLAETVSQTFTVDKTQPEGTISIDGRSVWDTVWKILSFDIFKNDTYNIELTSKDRTSGVESTAYYKTRDQISEEALMELNEDEWIKSTSFSVSPNEQNEQFVVYGRVIDRAGNVRYLYPTNGAVADDTKPEITITNLSTSRNGIFRDDVTLHIDVTDPINGNTYSGIKLLEYTVRATGNVTANDTYNILSEPEYPVQSRQSWSGNITIPAAKYNSNDVTVSVHVVDFSGNDLVKEIQLSIDNTDPTIQVTYDLNSPLNERYYNATRTATVTVTERNFDESAVRFNITNTDGTMPSISGWSHSADSGVSDNATHTCYVTFAADGDYTLTLNTTDLAGNDSHYTQVDDFTIDQTDPTIQVSYDNNSDAENGYFNAERTATITVTEHNFNAAEVNAAITARLQGTGVSAPGLGSWSTRGDVHTTTVNFSADADYTFDIDYTDLAGNAAADYQGDTFTIDQTVPEVEFFDIVDKSANKDMVAPGVTYSDINYSENGVKLTLKGAKHDEKELTGTRTGIANGESIKMDDFARTKENDDLYTLTAAITDKAGNVTEQSVTFSVNRFGSVYVFSDDTEKLLDDYYAKEEQDLVVTEINVDTLVNNGISYGRDGELVNLEKGSDYTVRESGSDVSWKEYQYTIDKKNFEEEGHYTVTIDSEDRATNVQNNKVKDSDIEFVIDKTAPSVVITGVENGEQYRADSRDMTVNVADNMAMGTVDIYLGDGITPDKSYKASEIERTGGALTYTIGNADEFQDVRAVARDAAGNEAETEGISVLVTSNLLIQYVNNTPLLVGSIIVVLLIAGGACWYFLIFKKKKNEQAK